MAKMLVVDDEPAIRQVLADFLTVRGHAVEAAASGAQALDLLRRYDFAVVFLDIVMPGMDGIEIIRRLRVEFPALTIIMISGVTDQQLAQQSMELGAFDYITKPFDLDYLDRVIRLRLARAS